MDNELVLYDFCGTLVNFQTANAFANYVIESKSLKRNIWEYIRILFQRTHLLPLINCIKPGMSLNKSMLLYQIRGCSYEELDTLAKDFYETKIRTNFIEPVLQSLINDIKANKTVVLVSGGYDIYLKYFAEDFNIQHVVCTSLKFKNGKFSGSINGVDCMNEKKVEILKHHLQAYNLSSIYKGITGYSDSETDIPLFLLCDRRVAVIKKDIPIPQWITNIKADFIKY